MASLTIDELKKALSDNGVEFPSSRLKKEEYVKLYEEHIGSHSVLGSNFSDEEGSQESRRVTSTNGNDSQIEEAIDNLSNDDLFLKLKELGYNAGPILQNTRRVYEKKLIALLRGETNGFNNTVNESNFIDVSDNEIEIKQTRRSLERNATPQPKARESSREPSSPQSTQPVREISVPRRVSYIEKIQHGKRIIEPADYIPSSELSDFRRRTGVDQAGDRYVGRWSPDTKHLKTGLTQERNVDSSSFAKKIILAVLLAILLALLAIVLSQWSATDPYKIIEEHVQKEVEDLTAQKSQV